MPFAVLVSLYPGDCRVQGLSSKTAICSACYLLMDEVEEKFTMGYRLHSSKGLSTWLSLVLGAITVTALGAESGGSVDRALTNWQAAYSCFQKAGAMAARKEYQQAQAQLSGCATNLSEPYDRLAKHFLIQLDLVSKGTAADESSRMDAVADICTRMHAYKEAAELKAAAGTEPPKDGEGDDDLRAWRLLGEREDQRSHRRRRKKA